MNVLLANEITPDMLVSSNAPVRLPGEVEWSDQAWTAGDLVTRTSTRRVYRAAYDVPAGKAPPEENIATAQLPYWQDLRPMNQWAMFDGMVQTQTVGPENEDLEVVIEPGAVNDVWLGGLVYANSAQVTVLNKPGGDVVYDQEKVLYKPVTTFWDWWFAPFSLSGDTMFAGIPAYTRSVVTIRVKTDATARIGMAAIGSAENLGYTLWDPETNYRNYSARQLDQKWGPSEGTGGVVTRDQNYIVSVRPDDAPRVSSFMDSAMRRPAVWLPHGDPKFEGIRGFGQAVDARMRYPNSAIVELSLHIRGFI